ncbi:MAG: 2-phosphosulfolactate phosphatase [Ktedonobacteraceae bacterium]|nr:2-phosphosulfolactate phosphatase [Ktedonobacteraceae bacterium]
MQLQIYFTPADLRAVQASVDDIYIVIDLIRATTSITTVLERGAARVFVANTLEQARMAVEKHPGCLLCGERHALPLPDFDYGNSPAQFSRLDLSGRELILTTTNGSRAFYACPEQSIRLVGCLYNGRAVAARALELARQHDCNITIVCAAESGYFALDDATCAGYLASEIQHLQPSIEISDSVSAATAFYATYPPPELAHYCRSTQSIIQLGLQDDVDFCMMVSKSQCVPSVIAKEEDTGLLIIE